MIFWDADLHIIPSLVGTQSETTYSGLGNIFHNYVYICRHTLSYIPHVIFYSYSEIYFLDWKGPVRFLFYSYISYHCERKREWVLIIIEMLTFLNITHKMRPTCYQESCVHFRYESCKQLPYIISHNFKTEVSLWVRLSKKRVAN